MSTTELYEFHGPNFKFPILLTWHDVIAEIKPHPSAPLLKIQQAAFDAQMTFLGAEFHDESWWLQEIAAKECCVISMLADPEEILEWQPLRKDAPANAKEDYADPFISDYTRSPFAVIRDNLTAELVWQSFSKFMLHRLLNTQKPVDLYFARIVPLQMRADWKAITTAWETKHVKEDRFNPEIDSITNRGVAGFLAADHITGVVKGPSNYKNTLVPASELSPRTVCTASWTLEIIPNESFDKMARRLELYRRYPNGHWFYYWKNINNQLKIQLPNAIEVYANYIKKAALPWALLYRPKQHCVPGVKNETNVKGHHCMGYRYPSPIGAARDAAIRALSGNECADEALASTDEKLPSMPIVQSKD